MRNSTGHWLASASALAFLTWVGVAPTRGSEVFADYQDDIHLIAPGAEYHYNPEAYYVDGDGMLIVTRTGDPSPINLVTGPGSEFGGEFVAAEDPYWMNLGWWIYPRNLSDTLWVLSPHFPRETAVVGFTIFEDPGEATVTGTVNGARFEIGPGDWDTQALEPEPWELEGARTFFVEGGPLPRNEKIPVVLLSGGQVPLRVWTFADGNGDLIWTEGEPYGNAHETVCALPEPWPAPASIGDRVWFDLDWNGQQDRGENGVGEVVVRLFDGEDNLLATTVTADDGSYLFSNLLPGEYHVGFDLPPGLNFTDADRGDDDALDSDADPVTGLTINTTLERGEADLSWDAGVVGDCGECEGKVTTLTLRYDGEIADAHIVVEQKKVHDPVFDGIVQPGESFSFVGADKNGTLGTEISIYVDDVLDTKIHTSCSKPIGPGLVAGSFYVVTGASRKGGELCPITGGGDCGECEGKVTSLTLRYDGEVADAHIVVEQKKVHDPVFDGIVQPGESFSFVGSDKNGTLGTEISIYVDDVLDTKIHTSCSKPIGPGLVAGSFYVVTGTSLNGGELCPLE